MRVDRRDARTRTVGIFSLKQRRETMRATAIVLSALLLGAGLASSAGAQAATTPGDAVPAAARMPAGALELAEANHNSPNKLGDKYLTGKSGGRYGIGGTERNKAQGAKPKAKPQGGNTQGATPPVVKQQ
jgi:hypothetical protein